MHSQTTVYARAATGDCRMFETSEVELWLTDSHDIITVGFQISHSISAISVTGVILFGIREGTA